MKMEMDIGVDEYVKGTIVYSLGLPVSDETLEMKIRASDELRSRVQKEYDYVCKKLKEKDDLVEQARSEASLNAQALKKFVEENQKLATECGNLLSRCARWEKECSLYDHDREVLMEFANESDEKAKDAEIRVVEAENELRRLKEELQYCKQDREIHMLNESRTIEELQILREKIEFSRMPGYDDIEDDSIKLAAIPAGGCIEESLLDSLVSSVLCRDRVVASGRSFLEANSENESCQRLLNMWDSLKQSTRDVIELVASVSTLQKDKEHLRINLTVAEEEVRVIAEDINILDEENKRLLRQINREGQGSAGKHSSSASAKGNKRKSSPRACSAIKMAIDYNCADPARLPLSPLQHNSPDSRMQKK